ncbi:hypothetical protein ACFYY2_19770 [Streptomyces sp. NPDC001822]|uniref:hypothetical protein n=1 Tax=Streptomyces sp. NPDC001822 TaxID=3364614 RepID=UPI0036AA2F28
MGSGDVGGLSSTGGATVAGADVSAAGGTEAELPGAGAEEELFRGGFTDADAEALAPGAAVLPEADAPCDGAAPGAPETVADASGGVAPGTAETAFSLGAGLTSAFSARFSSCPESGSQGALEFPPRTATTSVTAYTAQTAARTQPTRR